MFTYTDDLYCTYIPDELKSWFNEHSPQAPDWMAVYHKWIEHDKDVEKTKRYYEQLFIMSAEQTYDSDHPVFEKFTDLS